jgi:hypothetical protein
MFSGKKKLIFLENMIIPWETKKQLQFLLPWDMIVPLGKKSNLNSFSLGT